MKVLNTITVEYGNETVSDSIANQYVNQLNLISCQHGKI